MFDLPKNESVASSDVTAVASLIVEAFYNEREMYKCSSHCVSRTSDGKAMFGSPEYGYGANPVLEKHTITKEAFDLALKQIKDKGWHVYKRCWYVPSGLNWSYVMVDNIPLRVYNNRDFTILF